MGSHGARIIPMTLAEVMEALEAKADPKFMAIYAKRGQVEKHFGVKMGDLRALAKQIKSSHSLALELWATECLDAMLLATLIIKPKELSLDDMDRMVREVKNTQLADWLTPYVIKVHPDKEQLRMKWLQDSHPMALRAGWSLTAERAAKNPAGLDILGLLDRIEAEMGSADPLVQWTMNCCLAEIGINHAQHRQRAMAIGEALGVYRDYPVAKGCTSPFAPIWIEEMVKRQG